MPVTISDLHIADDVGHESVFSVAYRLLEICTVLIVVEINVEIVGLCELVQINRIDLKKVVGSEPSSRNHCSKLNFVALILNSSFRYKLEELNKQY